MDVRQYTALSPDFDAAQELTPKDFENILTKIGPKSYTLNIPARFSANMARVFVIGCQGMGSEWQKKVADLMAKQAALNEPLCIIVLGDNIYNTGASNPFDKKFKTQFFDMQYPAPAFVLIGNHDGNYDKKSAYANRYASYTMGAVRQMVGWEVEKYEVLETYLPTKMHSVEQQIEKFSCDTLNRDQLAAWNMPYAYYSIIIGEKEFFFLNSNSIFVDYIAYREKKDKKEWVDPNKNQIAWLKKQYDLCIAAKRMPILLSHHPADLTLGKRIISFDAWHYASDEALDELNKFLNIEPPTQSFTELFRHLLLDLKLTFPFKMSAHDHFINFINDPSNNICQLTMGAGGGALHSFVKFDYPFSGCQIEQYGFASISFPLKNNLESDKKVEIDIHTLEGLHLKFDTTSYAPIRYEGSLAFESLRQKIIIASHAFFLALKPALKKDNSSAIGFFSRGIQFVSDSFVAASHAYEHMTKKTNGKKETGIVLDLIAYFNQFEAPHIHHTYTYLRDKIEELQKNGEYPDSFISFLQEESPELFEENIAPEIPKIA